MPSPTHKPAASHPGFDDPELQDLADRDTRLRETEAGWTLEVGLIIWPHPHRPDVRWHAIRSWPHRPSRDVLREAVRDLLHDPRWFFVCPECGERCNQGHGWDIDTDDWGRGGTTICHGCATENHSVIF